MELSEHGIPIDYIYIYSYFDSKHDDKEWDFGLPYVHINPTTRGEIATKNGISVTLNVGVLNGIRISSVKTV